MNASRFFRFGVETRQDRELDDGMVSATVDQLRASALSHLGLELRRVQLDAGRLLLAQTIVEMETGEGKTLSTVIPACVLAKTGKGVLIATANDYLADRDAGWMGPLYADLGLTVSSITSQSTPQQRHDAYAAHVTYGTLREFAFDHLRERLGRRAEASWSDQSGRPWQRLDALIVDEADSVLIDEARTPLLITAPSRPIDEAMKSCFRWCAEKATTFTTPDDFIRIVEGGAVALTQLGRRRFLQCSMPPEMGSLTTTDIVHSLERAIWINQTIHRDSHYVVNGDRVELVDEYTGRAAANRAFGGGLHQAIEAREGLPLTPRSDPVARITVQDFVGKFSHLCGITATAWEDRRELADVYGLVVHRVPTHAPSQRRILPTIVCRGDDDKLQRIADEVQQFVSQRRAVLIGTRTVARSEQLSGVLQERSIGHVVLNARNPKQEAETISRAGRPGQVTVATNMAGRGTDIRLDDEVTAAGGLHVIVSEPHAAARIDRQLIGRAARQGDPGSARLFISLNDEILDQAYTSHRVAQIRASHAASTGEQEKRPQKIVGLIKRAQRTVARNHRSERGRLTAHEARLSESLQHLGLDPHLDPLPDAS